MPPPSDRFQYIGSKCCSSLRHSKRRIQSGCDELANSGFCGTTRAGDIQHADLIFDDEGPQCCPDIFEPRVDVKKRLAVLPGELCGSLRAASQHGIHTENEGGV